MGEGNVSRDELAASAAAAGGIGAQAAGLAGVVRHSVVGHGVDAVFERTKDDPESRRDGPKDV